MGFINWILSIFRKSEPVACGLSFSNSPKDKEKYEQRKKQKIDYAFSDFYFWDELETNLFIKNEEYAEKRICPYCQSELPERKGNTFKCLFCKNKVHKSNDYYSGKEIILTDDEKKIQYEQCKELSKRKKFLEIYQYIDKIILPVPTIPEIGELFKQNLSEDKNKNIEILLQLLHLGIPEYYQKENRGLNKLRNCRMYEGQLHRLYGNKEQATNAFMSLLYLDLIDEFSTIFDGICLDSDIDVDDNGKFILSAQKKKQIMKQAFKIFKEKNILIAPAIYGWAFDEDLPLEKFEQIFKFNANSLIETLQFKVPITPDEAWEKVIEYRSSLDKAQ